MVIDKITPNRPIPLELVGSIIGHVHDDPPTLTSCSLVCRDWVFVARYYLFSNTKLGPENAHRFANIVSSPSSTLVPFIRHLEVKDKYEQSPWLTRVFPRLTCLSSVTTISVASSTGVPLSHQTLRALCSFEALLELKLVDCAFNDFGEVQTLVCSLPRLESFYLEGQWPAPGRIVATTFRPPSSLRELFLRCEMTHVLGWFLILSPVPLVQKLSLHGVDASELTSVGRYLQALGPTLTHLTIHPYGSVYQCLFRGLDVSHNSHLQYLKLLIDCDSVNLTFARGIISRVDSLQFSELELSLFLLRNTPGNRSDWEELDELLTQTRYSSLTKVTVEAIAILNKVEAVLPRCHTRGILRGQNKLSLFLSQS